MKLKVYLVAISLFLFISTSSRTSASPWMEAADLSLRADLQLLNDTGAINLPVTTYPLMWASVAPELKKLDQSKLSEMQLNAYLHVRRKMNFAVQRSFKNKVKGHFGKEERRFTSFGSDHSAQAEVSLSSEYTGKNFAGKIKINYQNKDAISVDENEAHLDGSYIAYKLSNWVLDAGATKKWWGPGIDTSLILSTNARPLPAIAIRRNNSQAFETPWLSWIGPWTFTAQIAHLEHERFVADAKLWNSRATFKPFKNLELGLSWSYQWGGKGQPETLDQFIDGLLGRTECVDGSASCGEELQTKLGNQLAGFDGRWSGTIGGTPYAIYAQSIGEDSPSPGTLEISDKSFLYGLETQFSLLEQRMLLNIEYTDTQANCGADGDTSQDCFYEHSIYRTGYRYNQRSIGSTYDNDAETLSLTLISRLLNRDAWKFKLRQMDLNTNNRDRHANDPLLGNSVSKIADELTLVSFEYLFNTQYGNYTLGVIANDSSVYDKEYNLFVDFEIFFAQ
ncbi:MAG: capsule assembly Wzi family protein [Kangiellaceae bacterium]